MSYNDLLLCSSVVQSTAEFLLDEHLHIPKAKVPKKPFQEPTHAQLCQLSIFFPYDRDVAEQDSDFEDEDDEEEGDYAEGFVVIPERVLYKDTSALLLYLQTSEASRETIRELTLFGFPSCDSWNCLVEVLVQLTHLEKLYWQLEIILPERILHVLQKNNPTCRIYYTFKFHHCYPYDNQLPDEEMPMKGRLSLKSLSTVRHREAIVGCELLYSLKIEVVHGGRPNQEAVEFAFRVIQGCPGLKELDLSIYHGGGCVHSGGQPYAFDFMSQPDVMIPSLEVLKLHGYRLDELSDGGEAWHYGKQWKQRLYWPVSLLPEVVLDKIGEQTCAALNFVDWHKSVRRVPDGRTSLDCWLEVMNWSYLHTLDITNPPCGQLSKLKANVLPRLKTLVLSRPHGHDVIDILGTSSFLLKTLTIKGMGTRAPLADVLNVVSKHQHNLKHLTIYQPENTWNEQGEEPIAASSAELSTLVASCRQLESIALNVRRTCSWDDEFYHALEKSLSLTHISVHYSSPDLNSTSDIYAKPNDRWQHGVRSNKRHYMTDDEENDEANASVCEETPDPSINQKSVMQLFENMCDNKVGREICKFEVFVGNWDERFLSRGQCPRPQKRVAFYSCESSKNGTSICRGGQIRNDK